MKILLSLLPLLPMLAPVPALAAEGSGGFCLFELPDDGTGKRKLINLTIVQYVEIGKDEFKIVYGGGALGSGYEAKVPLATPEDADALLERMRKTAADCHS